MNEHRHADEKRRHAAQRAIHKDWRAWAVVGLMLLAMLIYILTMDESIVPGVGTAPEQPAAASP